jgi:hypothetical protein
MTEATALASIARSATAFELVAARVSGGPLPLSQVGASLLLWLALELLARPSERLPVPVRAALRGAVAGAYLWSSFGTTLVELGVPAAFAFAPAAVAVSTWSRLREGTTGWDGRAQAVASLLAALLDWGLRAGTRPQDLPLLMVAATAITALTLVRWPRAGLLCGAAALWPGRAPQPWPDRVGNGPDVLLVTVDTLRWDAARDMDAFRRVGASGMLVEASAASGWTLPSMATVLTGRDVPFHRAVRRDDGGYTGISESVPTLAERLSAAGWHTAATVQNPFLGPWFGFGRGFDRLDHDDVGAWALPGPPFSAVARTTGTAVGSWLGLMSGPAVGVDRRLAWAREVLGLPRQAPLFLWVHLLDVHRPWRHAWELDLPWPKRAALAWDLWEVAAWRDHRDDVHAAYDHEVEVVDAALDAFLAGLPPGDRVVVLTSDHGEAFGEHDGWEHGHALWQELLAVPLAVSGVDAPARVPGNVDIAATVLHAAGLDLDGLDGVPLQTSGVPERPLHAQSTLYGDPSLRALRLGAEKVIAADGGEPVRYDLSGDPGELRPGPAGALAGGLLPRPGTAAREELSPAVREQLRQLGYVE